MSQQTVIGELNRLLASQCYSLADYLSNTVPWTHKGNEELVEATRHIVADHKHYSQRLADAIEDHRGTLETGSFPMRFLSLNDVALDYLLSRLIEDQQSNSRATEQCVDELVEDQKAWSLASEVLGSERAHLEILKEFLPQSETLPDGG